MKILKETDKSAIKTTIEILKNDGVVCFATETVYALACNASSDIAVAKLYEIKKRDINKPIAVFVANLTMAKKILELSKIEEKIIKTLTPGMITVILKQKSDKDKKIKISKLLNHNDTNLGMRIPNHEFCLKLLSEFNGVIAATSANPSNEEPAINVDLIKKYFANKVDLIIDGGICNHKIASTVFKIENDKIKIIREGLITKDHLKYAAKINE